MCILLWWMRTCHVINPPISETPFLPPPSTVELNAVTKDGWAPIHYTISHPHVEVLGLLLERGASVDGRNMGGATALHLAAGQGNKPALHLLLDKGEGGWGWDLGLGFGYEEGGCGRSLEKVKLSSAT